MHGPIARPHFFFSPQARFLAAGPKSVAGRFFSKAPGSYNVKWCGPRPRSVRAIACVASNYKRSTGPPNLDFNHRSTPSPTRQPNQPQHQSNQGSFSFFSEHHQLSTFFSPNLTKKTFKMPPKAADKKPASKAPATASKAPEKKDAGKKTAASGDKKKRTKTRKETYSSYIYKGEFPRLITRLSHAITQHLML